MFGVCLTSLSGFVITFVVWLKDMLPFNTIPSEKRAQLEQLGDDLKVGPLCS
jgi:hypothetical protein